MPDVKHIGMLKPNPTPVEQLLLLRRRKNWTQIECARRLGVKPRTITAWEVGTRKPTKLTEKSIQAFVDKESRS